MRMKNIVLSAVFTLLLYFIYAYRHSLGQIEFLVVFFGLLIAGGIYAARELLSREEVKSDERTQLLTGKAARITVVATAVLIILTLAYLAFTGRPTSANGVLAILLGAVRLVYSITYAYLEKA